MSQSSSIGSRRRPRLLGMTTSAFDPASRFRFVQFIPGLEKAGWEVVHRPNVPDRLWKSRLPGRIPRAVHHRLGQGLMKWNRWRDVSGAENFDAVFVNRDLAGRGGFFERRLLRRNPRVVFDFDDAIFIGRNEATVRWMCRNAAWVTPGNQYLAEWVQRETERFTVVPTVVDTELYRPRKSEAVTHQGPVRVGWSGSDQSIRATLVPHLEMLAALQSKLDFELVVITNTRPDFSVPSLRWSFIPWTPEGDSELPERMDVGLMPLVEDEFSRGKCGLKLLQYMASGLPTVASPVGVNSTITQSDRTGFLAGTAGEWAAAIEALVRSAEKRAQMGAAGRKRCEESYSVVRWLPVLLDLLSRVGRGISGSSGGAGMGVSDRRPR